MKRGYYVLPLILLILCSVSCNEENEPADVAITKYVSTPYNSDLFTAVDDFSDEFDGYSIDSQKWDTPEDAFASWAFKSNNAWVESGNLRLRATHDEYVQNGTQFYFSSGMLRSKTTRKYGYYEARVKGADLWPGVCSAFWLYTKGIQCAKEAGNITYNEIDVMELQQIASDKRMMACNIHVYAYNESLVNTFCSASTYPEMGQSQFLVDFDPEDDYHTYACENRPDSIVFYIDNRRVASKPNIYWHLDQGMYVTLSLGLRTPYEEYVEGVRQPVETSEAAARDAGFPVDMIIDYVRVYERDYSGFPSDPQSKFDEAHFN